MDALQLIQEGRLSDALRMQTDAVKGDPRDRGKRTLLFELLCFAGDYDRAERQLKSISAQSAELSTVVFVYENLIDCERARRRVFVEGSEPKYPGEPPEYAAKLKQVLDCLRADQAEKAKSVCDEVIESLAKSECTVDDTKFPAFRDGDDILAPVLEFFHIRDYCWLPIEQIQYLELKAPENPRDLIWAQCTVGFHDKSEMHGHVPVLYWDSYTYDDDAIRLGRISDWVAVESGPVTGAGQRTFLLGDEQKGLLEIRNVSFGSG